MGTPVKLARTAPDFVFELDQLVDICISDEWGQVKARAQYASGENQYLSTIRRRISVHAAHGSGSQNLMLHAMIVIPDARYLLLLNCRKGQRQRTTRNDGDNNHRRSDDYL